MSDSKKCPNCKTGQVTSSAGKLEQCGRTHLPTTKWTCSTCHYTAWDPSRAAWQTDDLRDPFTHKSLMVPRVPVPADRELAGAEIVPTEK